MDRYHRQTLLPQIGLAGQVKLSAVRVAIVGCGALGTVSAELLVRAGVGFVRLIDRDLVELTNLQRQTLYTEADVADQSPKAAAAARRLAAINSAVALEPFVADVHSGNVEALLTGVDLFLDGTDNADTRYLINDVAVKHNRPWVYGAAVGVEGRAMAVSPGRTPCLRCVFPDPPAAGELPTCDTAGVLASTTVTIGALQARLALQLLIGEPPPTVMTAVDLWSMRFRSIDLTDARRADCPACGRRVFEFLDRPPEASQATLCGQNAVQIRPATPQRIDLAELATKLARVGVTQRTPFLLRCDLTDPPGVRLTIFPDARALIHGINDIARARSMYARFVGN